MLGSVVSILCGIHPLFRTMQSRSTPVRLGFLFKTKRVAFELGAGEPLKLLCLVVLGSLISVGVLLPRPPPTTATDFGGHGLRVRYWLAVRRRYLHPDAAQLCLAPVEAWDFFRGGSWGSNGVSYVGLALRRGCGRLGNLG